MKKFRNIKVINIMLIFVMFFTIENIFASSINEVENVTNTKSAHKIKLSNADFLVDNEPHKIDSTIITVNGVYYLPVRDIGNMFNTTIAWDSYDKRATLSKKGKNIVCTPNSDIYYKNGVMNVIPNGNSPIMFNNKLYVPAYIIASDLDYHYLYDENNNTLIFSTTEIILEENSEMILVNRENTLDSTYIPEDLVYIKMPRNKEIQLTSSANTALEKMYNDAKNDGVYLYMISGYRSYDYQKSLYDNSVRNRGKEYTDKYILNKGESEHQSGLAIDITSKSNGYGLTESFENTKEFEWLKDNCYKYGFILRYPKDKVDITGINYEPWHFRYIGDVEKAEYIMENGLSFEEYKELNKA